MAKANRTIMTIPKGTTMTTTRTRRGIAAFYTAALLISIALAGCGGDNSGGGDADADSDAGRVGDAPATRDGDHDPADADEGHGEAGELVGRWFALSQDGLEMPEDTLVFTYRADGTGTVVEERSSTKEYNWVHDPDAGTLHILTENEDMLFDATFEGDTLTLVMALEGGEMRLVMRRMDAGGE